MRTGTCRLCSKPFEYQARVIRLRGKAFINEAPRDLCDAKPCVASAAKEAEQVAEARRLQEATAAEAKAVEQWHQVVPVLYHSGETQAKVEHLLPELGTWRPHESLFLHGEVGAGKTHQLAALMHLVAGTGHTIEWYTTRRLIADIDRCIGNKRYKLPAICDDPLLPDVLILSDFTAVRSTLHVAQKLGDIVDARYHNCRPVIIDDNLPLQRWVQRAGGDEELALEYDRIASRVTQMTRPPMGRTVKHPGEHDRRLGPR